MICMIYVILGTPFKFSFVEDDESVLFNVVEYLVDFYFLVDMVLTFFTPIYVN